MYFKKLELLGFKSFAEKTTLHFEPGITAVVGPNGCGKSNIFDSIRWVLGEQSVKSLRGSKMEDVIFSGTESTPALGYAEVSLTFANETKALPIDYDEVTVTRRLFRSGESEYLINKTQVRMRDILELFMGTGIGAESYSLIEQGKIDLILSSRPEDRRLVFDEAAGISKYKSQKKETTRKLEDAEANLLRVNDIIAELKRQINSLERQAAKAKRYKEAFDRLKDLEVFLALSQIKQIQGQLDDFNLRLDQLHSLESQDSLALERLSKGLVSFQEEQAGLEDALNSLRGRLSSQDNLISRSSQQLSFDRQRIEDLQKRIETVLKQKEELSRKIAQDEEKINGFRDNLAVLTRELEDKKGAQQKASAELEGISQAIQQSQSLLKEAKSRVLEYASQEAALHNQLQKLTSELNQAIARKKRLDIEKAKAEEELSSVSNNLKASQDAEEGALREFLGCQREFEEAGYGHNGLIAQKEALSASMQNLENDLAGLESQKEFLSNLKLRYENISESSNAIVFLEGLSDEKISGIILKIDQVQKSSETDLQFYNQARFKASGIAKPISLDPQEVINKIEELKQGIAGLNEELSRNGVLIAQSAERIAVLDKKLREDELSYNTAKNNKDNIQHHAAKLTEEFEVIRFECQDNDAQLDKLSQEEKSQAEGLFRIKEASLANNQEIERIQQEISAKNSLREGLLVELTRLKAEVSSCQEKVLGYEETRKILEDAWSNDKAALEALINEEISSRARIRELEDEMARLNSEMEGCRKEKALLEEDIRAKSAFLLESQGKGADLQRDILVCKDDLDKRKNDIHELKMRLQETSFRKSTIYERMQQVYKVGTEELDNSSQPQMNIDDALQEAEGLKKKIESYGQVNLVAIEEFDELRQRYDFLISQQQDLVKSKEALHEAILKINRTTRKMFLETFEKLAAEFKNYFRMLFGGGDAQLFLLDEQDILESGIEIACRPPGKKLQNVLLLSGGEKSMSAIALLFAIFKVKPSPFCVLDEIDAALDEANVDRFSRGLVDFTSQSQFIVITHNKKTIANANIMYGITMEKAGISKIVSVKLAQPPPQTQDKVLEPSENNI